MRRFIIFLMLVAIMGVALAQTYHLGFTIPNNDRPETAWQDLKRSCKQYDGVETAGGINFGEELRNRRAAKDQDLSIRLDEDTRVIHTPLTIHELLRAANAQIGLATVAKQRGMSLSLIANGSIYNRDGSGFYYAPALTYNPDGLIELGVQRLELSPRLTDYAFIYPPLSGRTNMLAGNAFSRLVKAGTECQDGFFMAGSNTEVYSPRQGNYVVGENLRFGIFFSNNWEIVWGGDDTQRNDKLSDSSFVEQAGYLGFGLSQVDAKVEVAASMGRYIIENPPLGLYETGTMFGIRAGGSWLTHSKFGFEGGVDIKIISRTAPNPKPPSRATVGMNYSPFEWDILGNGRTNNYGLGTKADVLISDGLAIENVAAYLWLGTGLVSARLPEQKLALGANYNAHTGRFGMYLNLRFNLGIN